MAGLEPRAAALGAAVLLALACSGGPPPQDLPPQTVSRSAPTPDPAPDQGLEAQQPARGEPLPPEKQPVVTIEPSETESEEEPTLVEAARRERARRQETQAPIAVINDANLREHAVGQLTFIEEEEEEESDGEGAEGGEGGEPDLSGRDEAYWRERVRGLRERWRAAADRVPDLEERAAELRRRFYETDDAYYRDTRIKPAWDRAIDLIAQSRAEADAYRLELVATLDEGRRAGALPGWLREGIELEPEPAEPEPEAHEPGEPVIFGEEPPAGEGP